MGTTALTSYSDSIQEMWLIVSSSDMAVLLNRAYEAKIFVNIIGLEILYTVSSYYTLACLDEA